MYIVSVFLFFSHFSRKETQNMARPFPILGFDVGGTKVAVSLVLSDGTLVASARVPNKEREPDDVLPAMVSAGKLSAITHRATSKNLQISLKKHEMKTV